MHVLAQYSLAEKIYPRIFQVNSAKKEPLGISQDSKGFFGARDGT